MPDVKGVTYGAPPSVVLFGLPIASVTLPQAVEHLCSCAGDDHRAAYVVVTPNVDHVVSLDRDQDLRRQYLTADLCLADGAPIVWSSHLFGIPLPGRVTGADLMPALLQRAAARTRVAVVGSRSEWAERDSASLRKRYPQVELRVFAPPLGLDPAGPEAERIAIDVERFKPVLVFVCLGFPRQERWALLHRDRLSGAIVLCCGAALDYLVGRLHRAPALFRTFGMEWLWRLVSEPRRLWRRYLIEDAVFLKLALREWRKLRHTSV